MHNITESLERLSERLAQSVKVNFFVASIHSDVPEGTIHGFGVVIERSDKPKASQIAGSSDGADSSHFRGVLGGVLTCVEWARLNCSGESQKRIYSSNDAVYYHLPRELKKWTAESSRVNHDLILKIARHLGDDQNITFGRIVTKDPRYQAAKRLAEKAAAARASVSESDVKRDEWELSQSDWDEDTEAAFRNALAKEP